MILLWIRSNLDKVFVVFMGIMAFASFCSSLKDLLIAKQLLQKASMITKVVMDISTVCADRLCSIKDRSFLNHFVNSGEFISSNFSIDDCYLSDNSQSYIKR